MGRFLLAISCLVLASSAFAKEQIYEGVIMNVAEGASGTVRAAEISQQADGRWLIHFIADQKNFDFTMPTYADASALADDVRIGGEVRCTQIQKLPDTIDCLVFTVTK